MYKKFSLMVFGLSLMLGFGVAAQTGLNNAPRTDSKVQERIQALQEKKEALKLKNCERVQSKLENKVKIYEQNKKKHVGSFVKSYQRMVTLAEKFEAEGYETTTLREHLATLDSMIKKFDADYGLYIQTLEDSQNFTCTEAENTFKVKLNQSREQLGGLKGQAVAIRTYWAQTIKTDVQALKSLVDTSESDSTESSDNNAEAI